MAQKKKKKPATGGAPIKLSMPKLIAEKGRKFEITSVLITPSWKDDGICSIILVRTRPNGRRIFGFYLVDTYYLGLKDTFFRTFESKEEEAFFIETLKEEGGGYIEILPKTAFNIIYQGIQYAKELEVKPHKDFAITQYLLPPAAEVPFVAVEFGFQGKPLYIQSPNDDPRKFGIFGNAPKSEAKGNYTIRIDGKDGDNDGYDTFEEV